jgi:hypothetical protein
VPRPLHGDNHSSAGRSCANKSGARGTKVEPWGTKTASGDKGFAAAAACVCVCVRARALARDRRTRGPDLLPGLYSGKQIRCLNPVKAEILVPKPSPPWGGGGAKGAPRLQGRATRGGRLRVPATGPSPNWGGAARRPHPRRTRASSFVAKGPALRLRAGRMRVRACVHAHRPALQSPRPTPFHLGPPVAAAPATARAGKR